MPEQVNEPQSQVIPQVLSHRELMKARREQAYTLHAGGWSNRQIATFLRVHPNTVSSDLMMVKSGLARIFTTIDPRILVADACLKLDSLANDSMQEVKLKAENDPVLRNTLRHTAMKALIEKMRLLLESGIIPRQPVKLESKTEFTGSIEVLAKEVEQRAVEKLQEFYAKRFSGIGQG